MLKFPVTYHGQILDVEIAKGEAKYTLREGESLVIRHEAEEIRLTREQPQAVRQVSGW
jgi:alpha,alpha-trehalose phosphorylase